MSSSPVPYERLPDRDAVGTASSPTLVDSQQPSTVVRPETYYGEGPFDPPSSEDESDLETGGLLDAQRHPAPTSPRLAELGGVFASSSDGISDYDLKKKDQWRWSTFGNYYVHDIDEKTTHPLIPPTNPSNTAYATWAPQGHSIAYVMENDLYILPNPTATPIRVTSSGNASLFHGVPDWVYEEEIFSADYALWWSPDAAKLTYLTFDETAVDTYNFPIYNPTDDNDAVIPYTSDVKMKYPKPGYNNPIVTVHVFDLQQYLAGTTTTASTIGPELRIAQHTYELEWPDRHFKNDSIIMEVAWVGNSSLIVKEVNRNADDGNVVLFDLSTDAAWSQGKVVRKLGKNGEQGDKGWIESIVQAGNSSFEHLLTQNELLTNVTMEYEAPTVVHSTIISDGYELNVQELRPPRMDDSGRVKYPVLFRVYGGPNSQMVDLKFSRSWHDYLACGLSYIIVTVDGRGTGFKGRHLRNPVKDNLGFYETIDQINAARIWAAKEYVDRKRIGIWGWSYGGFMASKVVEANAGVHSLSMAVALNPGGYINASISNVTGFHNVDYLLAHGSGDDNVHYANSAHLLDMFTKAQIRNFRFRMFTDRFVGCVSMV
ncbi:hypothetical protein H0H93_004801 [Arthromyces matolae]|nr:hypothetical protein H0H93_004801 [Arthromyces matolae]